MEIEKTTLQKIVEQKTDQIRIAIEEAIDKGAAVERLGSTGVKIDDVLFFRNSDGTTSVILRIDSKKIAKVCEPNLQELRAQAEQKREELQKLTEQIKEIEMNEPRKD